MGTQIILNNEIIKQLIKVLEQQASIYNDIFKISENKKQIIIENKVEELENLTKVEQTLVLKMGRFEEQREDLMNSISKIINQNLSDNEKNIPLKIVDIIKNVDENYATELMNLQGKIVQVIEDLNNINKLNSKLINNSLDYISFSINLYSDIDTGTNNYGNRGDINESQKRRFLDIKL